MDVSTKSTSLEYGLKVLEIEKRFWKLQIGDERTAKYTDLKQKGRELDDFIKEVMKASLREPDARSFVERYEVEKEKIRLYSKNKNSSASDTDLGKSSNIGYIILAGFASFACFVLGIKFADFANMYKNHEIGGKEKSDKTMIYTPKKLLGEGMHGKYKDYESKNYDAQIVPIVRKDN